MSIVVPALRETEDVLRSLASALQASRADLDVVVVVPDAANETAARVEALDDSRVRVVRSPCANLARARNIGIGSSRGELVALLDGGDEWTPDALDRRIAALDAPPEEANLVYGGIETRRADGSAVEIRPCVEGRVFEAILARNLIEGFGSTGLVRRKVFNTIGGFDPRLSALEDWDFLLRATRFFNVAAVSAPVCRRGDRTGAQDFARRSAVDLAARRTLHRRYGADMRDFGVETTFLMNAARLCLDKGLRERIWIVRALLQAVKREPRALTPYAGLVFCGLPDVVAEPLRRFRGPPKRTG